MRITSIETIPVRVPIRADLAIRGKGGFHAVSPFLLVRIHTDEGISGIGEVSCTPRWSGEDQVTAAHFIREYLAPQLQGQDPAGVLALSDKVNRAIAGNPFTKAAVEMALWDIAGKRAGLPVYRLFGGPVRESVRLKWSVSGVEPARAAEIAAWALERGFRSMKVKVGIDPEQDVARVRAVRAAIGPGVPLGIDANGAWTPGTAIRMIARLKEFDIAFAEQPVPHAAWLPEVRRAVDLPVVADESLYTAQDAMALAGSAAADIFSIYVGKSGGIAPARNIAAIAEASGIACTIGSNLEMGPGSAAMIHLALGATGIDYPCDIIGPFFYEDDLLKEPLPLCEGEARAPGLPGLGVELDEEKVRRYTVA